MGRVLSVVFALGLCALGVGLAACGCTSPGDTQQGAGDTDYTGTGQSRAMLVCQSAPQAKCNLWVRCSVQTVGGGAISQAGCAEDAHNSTVACEMDTAALQATGDADVDACTAALNALPCTSVCGRVPENPAVCMALAIYEPMGDTVTCAP
jgi:hypothetical protein